MINWYKVIGIKEDATTEEIEQAVNIMISAKNIVPDYMKVLMFPSDEQISNALYYLTDPDKRKKHDEDIRKYNEKQPLIEKEENINIEDAIMYFMEILMALDFNDEKRQNYIRDFKSNNALSWKLEQYKHILNILRVKYQGLLIEYYRDNDFSNNIKPPEDMKIENFDVVSVEGKIRMYRRAKKELSRSKKLGNKKRV